MEFWTCYGLASYVIDMICVKVDDWGLGLDERRVVLVHGEVCGRVREEFGKRWGCKILVRVY